MAWEATTTAFHSFGQLPSLFVIHSDLGIFTTCEELLSILLVISCQKLVHRVVDLVQLATGSSMEMEQTTLSIGRDHHIFSNSRSLQWSPPKRSKKTGVNPCLSYYGITYLKMVVGIGASMLSLQM